jgi:hypothetical protein
MLNGINISLGNSDLLDRALLVGLERFSKFGSASAFWKRFEEAKPRILGAIFDLLVKALQAIETVPEDVDFRMADFARYGCAVTQVLGLDPSEFTTAYRANVDKSEDESLAASIIGPIVMSFMASRSSWEGTPTELHRGLEQEALFANVDTKAAYIWPKSPHWLKKRIELVVTILDHKGIKIRWDFPAPGRVTITNENAENIPNDGNVVLPPL